MQDVTGVICMQCNIVNAIVDICKMLQVKFDVTLSSPARYSRQTQHVRVSICKQSAIIYGASDGFSIHSKKMLVVPWLMLSLACKIWTWPYLKIVRDNLGLTSASVQVIYRQTALVTVAAAYLVSLIWDVLFY